MGKGLPRGVFTYTSTGARGGVQPSERAEKATRDTFDQLTDKGLLDKRKTTLEEKGDVVLFQPYGANLSKSDPSALWK